MGKNEGRVQQQQPVRPAKEKERDKNYDERSSSDFGSGCCCCCSLALLRRRDLSLFFFFVGYRRGLSVSGVTKKKRWKGKKKVEGNVDKNLSFKVQSTLVDRKYLSFFFHSTV